jgi:hypothetical protein
MRTFTTSAAMYKYTALVGLTGGAVTGSALQPTTRKKLLITARRPAVRGGQAGASALLVIGADVGDLRAGLVSLVLRGWLV